MKIADSGYVHPNLMPTREYRYAVSDRTELPSSAMSNHTGGAFPNPVRHLMVIFSRYASSPVAARTLDVDYDPVSDTNGGATFRKEKARATDSGGNVALDFELDRTKYY